MTETKLIDRVRQYLAPIQGRDIELAQLRKDLNIDPSSPAWDGLRVILLRLCDSNESLLRPTGRKDGSYHVITHVKPVSVFGTSRERRPPYVLIFPKDRETQLEMYMAEQVVVREGDLILIAGRSNFGKTALCMNFLGENIDKRPILMGNEYTVINEQGEWEPAPRFLTRLDNMTWVKWCDESGVEKFTLLPVRDDYASHIVKDRINIIDWINVDTGEHYMIGTILESIKRRLGKGIAIIAIQKAEGAVSGRGGQFTQDFADCELLIDALGKEEILLTMGKVKESKARMYGKMYGYSLWNGVEVKSFREVVTCPQCKGKSVTAGKCDKCNNKGKVDAR
jgi:hypothetical protein